MMRKHQGSGKIACRIAELQSRNGLIPIEDLQEGYTPQLQDALSELSEIAGRINAVELVTATNQAQARDQWLDLARQGKFTNPELRYNRDLLRQVSGYGDELVVKHKTRLLEAIDALPKNAIGAALGSLAKSRLNDLIAASDLANLILEGDAFAATNRVTTIYGMPNKALVRQAQREIEKRNRGIIPHSNKTILTDDDRQRLQDLKLDAWAVREIFTWAAEQYGFAETRPVFISDLATSVDVRDTSSEGAVVLIPADYNTTGLKVIPLTIHEVGCHWRDSENMKELLPNLGAGNLKPMDELLYEGHAVDRGYQSTLLLDGFVRPTRQLYYPIAIDLAYREGKMFGETAKELFDIVRSDAEPIEQTLFDAWFTTYRVYRGSPCLSERNGYAYTKDRAYYGGRILAQELRQAGLDYILDYGTLRISDLEVLASKFKLCPQRKLFYPEQENMAQKLAEKLLRGDFTATE